MKICFIWVSKYRNFENFSLCLSSSEKFVFDPTSGELAVTQLLPLPDAFFGPGIVEVTGLFGRNGSGKSNALELICHVLKGGADAILSDFLLVVSENEKFVCYCSPQIRAHVRTAHDISIREYGNNVAALELIFFSNVFDRREHNFDSRVADISINNQYRGDAGQRKASSLIRRSQA